MSVNTASYTLYQRYIVLVQALERITVARQKGIHINPRPGSKALVPDGEFVTSTEIYLHLETAPLLSLPEH